MLYSFPVYVIWFILNKTVPLIMHVKGSSKKCIICQLAGSHRRKNEFDEGLRKVSKYASVFTLCLIICNLSISFFSHIPLSFLLAFMFSRIIFLSPIHVHTAAQVAPPSSWGRGCWRVGLMILFWQRALFLWSWIACCCIPGINLVQVIGSGLSCCSSITSPRCRWWITGNMSGDITPFDISWGRGCLWVVLMILFWQRALFLWSWIAWCYIPGIKLGQVIDSRLSCCSSITCSRCWWCITENNTSGAIAPCGRERLIHASCRRFIPGEGGVATSVIDQRSRIRIHPPIQTPCVVRF